MGTIVQHSTHINTAEDQGRGKAKSNPQQVVYEFQRTVMLVCEKQAAADRIWSEETQVRRRTPRTI